MSKKWKDTATGLRSLESSWDDRFINRRPGEFHGLYSLGVAKRQT